MRVGSLSLQPVAVVRTRLADERLTVALCLVFALALRVFIAFAVPPWQGPDEPKHFEYARTLVDKRAQLWAERRILNLDDTSPALEGEIIASMAKHHYWEYLGGTAPAVLPATFFDLWGWKSLRLDRPSLYYFVAAAVLLPFQNAGLETQLLAVRLLSAVLSALTVVIAYLAAKELAPGDRLIPLVSAAFVAALPMHAFIGGTVNSDNLVTLLGSAALLGIAVGFRRGFTVWSWALVLGALALALATKKVAVGLLPAVAFAGLLWLVSLRGRRLLLAVLGTGMAGALLGVIAATDLGGIRGKVAAYALNESFQLDMLLRVPIGSPESRALISGHLDWLFRSFWGIFGWFTIPLSPQLFSLLYLITLLCGVGLLVWLVRLVFARTHREPGWPGAEVRIAGVFLLAVVSMVVLAVAERLAYYSPSEVPQGRYLFVAVVPIAVLYALGLRALLPSRFLGAWRAALLVVLAFVALDLVAYTQFIWPYYYAK